ncbi:hypothetical protein WR25_04445 [Diploscapter pachys]|uniref:C-type lectin domain-containing protein n=1 Tax=Diploscapter pachys TaxID=2018661 RepID=A0A2A2LGJ4_9BILA|nr:hypothetical protein WR25_04445 [Diploscapter pachys]
MSFHDAYSFCASQNYNLISIHDQFYNNYLMNTAKVVFNSSYSSYFLGLNKVLTDTWQWSDNSTLDFNNWDRGEPSSANSCSVQRISDGKWLTYSCATRLPFICYNFPNISHPTTNSPIQTTAMAYNSTTTRYHKKCGVGLESPLSKSKNQLASSGSCDDGYTYFDRTGYCYKVQMINYTGFWDPVACPPAAIHSVEEDCFVKDLAVNFLSSQNCLPNSEDWDFFFYWIGTMWPITMTGTCQWGNDEPADYGNAPSWPWNCSDHHFYGLWTDVFGIVDKYDQSLVWLRDVNWDKAPVECRTGVCKVPAK